MVRAGGGVNAPERMAGLTAEQKAVRFEGVGASEVAAALGLSRRMSQAELWAIKTRRQDPPDDTALLRWGHAVQPYILGEYAQERGCMLAEEPPTLRRGRLIAHLDAYALVPPGPASNIVVEAKSRGSRDGFGEAGSANIPDEIMLQVTQQMSLAGLAVAHIPVLFVRPPIVTYEVQFDPELAEMIEAGVDRFWWHVEHDTPPSVNPDAPEAIAALRLLYRGTTGEVLHAPQELEHWRSVYHQATANRQRYADVEAAAKAHLLGFMKDASELVFADGGLLRRKLIKVKGYTVEPREQIDARFVKPKGESNAE
jgi:predicted phage-related endonuclease